MFQVLLDLFDEVVIWLSNFFRALSIKDFLGYIAAALTTVSFLPQVIQVLKTHKTKGISLAMYVIFCSGVFLWTLYGFAIQSPPVYIANIATLALATIILYLKIKNHDKK